jgi:hypothetical protein
VMLEAKDKELAVLDVLAATGSRQASTGTKGVRPRNEARPVG